MLTAQHIHAESDFDFTEVEFNVPALKIQLAKLLQWIGDWIEQRGYQGNGLRAVSACRCGEPDMAQDHGCGKRVEFFLRAAFGALGWLFPRDQPIVRA